MALISGFCNVAVIPVRSEPSHRAEQTTQLLYGEKALVLESNREWARIRCAWDNYEGWCRLSQLSELAPKAYKKPVKYLSGSHSGKMIFEANEMLVPYGSELVNLKKTNILSTIDSGRFRGKKLKVGELTITPELLKKAAMAYINAPYLWGGRSLAGIDCSGLTQMAYKLCNTPIPRDASQQAEKGSIVDFLQYAECGDLAFFDDKDGRITHVGMLLDNQNIIHATDSSGHVVIDRIDPAGIISISLKRRTHNLRFVKRMIGMEATPLPKEKKTEVTAKLLL